MASDPAHVIIRLPGAKVVNKRVRKGTETFQTLCGINNILEIERERKLKHEHSENSGRRHSANNNNQATEWEAEQKRGRKQKPSFLYNLCRYVDEMGKMHGQIVEVQAPSNGTPNSEVHREIGSVGELAAWLFLKHPALGSKCKPPHFLGPPNTSCYFLLSWAQKKKMKKKKSLGAH